ncbi:hypothetical protein EFR43_07260, partial [Lactobacillus delbrueckii subsp. lactis]
NLTAFTGVDSQNLPDVMVSVQFILAIGEFAFSLKIVSYVKAGHDFTISIQLIIFVISMTTW